MANVFANYAFNFDEMNLSRALPNINTSTFGKDVTTSFNSQTFYDYYEVYWTEGGAQSRSFFGGYNFYTTIRPAPSPTGRSVGLSRICH